MKTKDLILSYLEKHESANYTQLRVMGESQGKTDGAVLCALYHLMGLGLVRRTGFPKKYVFSIIWREQAEPEGFDLTGHSPSMLMINDQLKKIRGPIWSRTS
ncbi:hypothetical protein [Pectobacterium versatile]|uniref:hypothetical protein n=1 Tax=Pectobacterium versatile TaxID=2488639 RepID=UPI00102E254F|nr:hypothetical protein [Pectobacterium versatile]TAI99834.1 hypothetical protein EG332_04320 [Pectobacterium versatile]UEQ10490.1 hypothetical protein LLE50_05095 [Pectobacterium versatile]GKX40318.1 hypothetical protein SOASR014_40570 [Pectobacterium carotovorum subsp. carotovorum]GLX46409.1 hypothetical protein Pcaca01_40770 [Pectobacterium carotovorum subsp. carotovorum]